ncbi:hypothetical protein HNQ77_004673 [Silvibacterium bohemicum]|uniref:ABC transporter substrate-binding protein n=1 Tax=Silvibacterium bohemicum TaxID=1577686 RepID=A0A841K8T6_9BACT|nr:DUF2076 family protein [Silvibacterium bohemicum]MBB6146694.1 hypothetical protein [Silvibacterium bohemicum]
MTPQEAQMLQDLVNKVESTQLSEKDPDAEALLNDGLARDPDALYKLAQTVLVQNLALNQARAQLQAQSDQLRQQLAPPQQQPARATSFLGSLLHRQPAAAPPPNQAPQYAPPQYQTVPQYSSIPQAGQQVVYEQAPSSGAGSFLRSAATTAAGVAAGALAFEGIESLIHGGHEGGFFGGGPGYGGGGYGGYGMGGGAPVEETVNNYYGDPNSQGGYTDGPDMQPQGPYEGSGQDQDMQPQGPYDDSGNTEEASYDDQGMDADMGDDGGGNYGSDDMG